MVVIIWGKGTQWGFWGGASGKEPACRSPWRRAWQLIPVFLIGESHGQRSLVGYSPWGRKELDMTEESSTTTTSQSFGNMSNIIVFCYKENRFLLNLLK